ncbi:MAG: hypothetical protein ABW104_19900 [Candidatus Thiodiazotropha sp. 6PLUC2]
MRELNPRFLPDSEILKLAEQGLEFSCPVCQSKLKPYPLTWRRGEKLGGLTCLNDGSHFLVYGDEAKKLDSFHAWIEEISCHQIRLSSYY